MTYKFTIPGRLPGMNEIINTARTNRYMAATMKKASTAICATAIRSSRLPVFTSPIGLEVWFYEPDARRDVDNIQAGGFKFLLDALVSTERIKNDTREWVPQLRSMFPEPDKKNPRLEVYMEELYGHALPVPH